MAKATLKIRFQELRAVRFVCSKCKSAQEISLPELVKREASATKGCPFCTASFLKEGAPHNSNPIKRLADSINALGELQGCDVEFVGPEEEVP